VSGEDSSEVDAPPGRLASARVGELVGDTFVLGERIGAGGMGEVYLAEHRRLGKQFALKLLRSKAEPNAVKRFRREARAIARIESEHVVTVVDSGEARDGTPFIAMELLRGEDLRSLLARAAPLPIPRAVSLILEACRGVATAHRAGMIHRDLKPGNLFVTRRETGEDWLKVLDFGIAKLEGSSSTVEGALIGTVKYMAPEQLEDGANVGPAVDIYALGAILYECLCGAPPHNGVSMQESMFKIMNETPVPLSNRRADIPDALSAAIQRALAKRPTERFESSEAFANAIAPFAQPNPSSSGKGDVTLFELANVPRRRRPRSVAGITVFFGAVSVFVAFIWRHDAAHATKVEQPERAVTSPEPSPGTSKRESIWSAASAGQMAPARAEAPTPSVTAPRRAVTKQRALTATPLAKQRFDTSNPYDH